MSTNKIIEGSIAARNLRSLETAWPGYTEQKIVGLASTLAAELENQLNVERADVRERIRVLASADEITQGLLPHFQIDMLDLIFGD